MSDIADVRFHDLKHKLLLLGAHPKVAQERLGRSTISTTLDLYNHVTETIRQDAAARVDATLGHAISAALC